MNKNLIIEIKNTNHSSKVLQKENFLMSRLAPVFGLETVKGSDVELPRSR